MMRRWKKGESQNLLPMDLLHCEVRQQNAKVKMIYIGSTYPTQDAGSSLPEWWDFEDRESRNWTFICHLLGFGRRQTLNLPFLQNIEAKMYISNLECLLHLQKKSLEASPTANETSRIVEILPKCVFFLKFPIYFEPVWIWGNSSEKKQAPPPKKVVETCYLSSPWLVDFQTQLNSSWKWWKMNDVPNTWKASTCTVRM